MQPADRPNLSNPDPDRRCRKRRNYCKEHAHTKNPTRNEHPSTRATRKKKNNNKTRASLQQNESQYYLERHLIHKSYTSAVGYAKRRTHTILGLGPMDGFPEKKTQDPRTPSGSSVSVSPSRATPAPSLTGSRPRSCVPAAATSTVLQALPLRAAPI